MDKNFKPNAPFVLMLFAAVAILPSGLRAQYTTIAAGPWAPDRQRARVARDAVPVIDAGGALL